MTSTKIFSSTSRDAAHKHLDGLYAKAKAAGRPCEAECRENPESAEPYEVWDGPRAWEQRPPEPALAQPDAPIEVNDALAEAIAERLFKKMMEKANKP